MKRALLLNFIAAVTIYIGMVIGVVIGNVNADANLYIFAFSGGIFIYVSLTDMVSISSVNVCSVI